MRIEENIVEWSGGGATVRVWLDKGDEHPIADWRMLYRACQGFKFFEECQSPDPYGCAQRLLDILPKDRVSALQVTIEGKYGVVIYPEWP